MFRIDIAERRRASREKRQQRKRWSHVAAKVAGLLAVVFTAHWLGATLKQSESRETFRNSASRDVGLVVQQLGAASSSLIALDGLYAASEEVTAEEFSAFGQLLLRRQTEIVALFQTDESHAGRPYFTWSTTSNRTRPSVAQLAASLASLPPHNDAPAGTLTVPPHGLLQAPDEVLLSAPLSRTPGTIGAIISLSRTLSRSLGGLEDRWAALAIQVAGAEAPIAQLGLPFAGGSQAISTRVRVGDVDLEIVARPTAAFAASARSNLPQLFAAVAGIVYLIVLLALNTNRESRAARASLQSLQSALPLPWARMDAKAKLQLSNQPFRDLLEVPEDPDAAWQHGIEAEDYERIQELVLRALEIDEPCRLEFAREAQDGSLQWILAVARADHAALGEGEVQIVWMDITETHELEEQLWRAQKLEAMGQLAGGIAHDFNNALTAITGYSSMVLASLDPDGAAYEDVQHILNASQRAAGLTSRLLALTRTNLGQRAPTDLVAVIEQTVKLARSTLGRHVNVEFDLPDDLPPVHADAVQLEHLLLNLLFNARDAMPGGGSIVVAAEFVDFETYEGGAVVAPSSGPHVVLSVSDTGQGMAPTTLERIFEPLYTTKSNGQGTGLGLSMVRSAVSGHEGGLWVFSELDVGTTIRVALPTSTRDAGPLPMDDARPGNERILVVDDQPAILDLADRILTNLGYTVVTATTAQHALEIASERPFDLFLLDVLLPDHVGTQLAIELISIQPEAAVLLMSGYSARLLEDREAGGLPLDLLSKPFTRTILAQRVRQALERVTSNNH